MMCEATVTGIYSLHLGRTLAYLMRIICDFPGTPYAHEPKATPGDRDYRQYEFAE